MVSYRSPRANFKLLLGNSAAIVRPSSPVNDCRRSSHSRSCHCIWATHRGGRGWRANENAAIHDATGAPTIAARQDLRHRVKSTELAALPNTQLARRTTGRGVVQQLAWRRQAERRPAEIQQAKLARDNIAIEIRLRSRAGN